MALVSKRRETLAWFAIGEAIRLDDGIVKVRLLDFSPHWPVRKCSSAEVLLSGINHPVRLKGLTPISSQRWISTRGTLRYADDGGSFPDTL